LIAQPDGSWAILDPGSENGTSINGSEVATGVAVQLLASPGPPPARRLMLGSRRLKLPGKSPLNH